MAKVADDDRDRGRRLRRAYRAAWQDRSASGNTSDDVLAAHLREHGLAEELLDETSPGHQFVFGWWRRGVPPRGITWELTKQAGRALMHMGDVARSVHDAFRGDFRVVAGWEMPPGKRGVTGEVKDASTVQLTFERTLEGEAVLRDCLNEPGGFGGWRRPPVWFDMDATQPSALVMIGDANPGSTQVPREIWKRMRDVSDAGLYADGFLEVREHDDELETGTLMCTYLPEDPVYEWDSSTE